MLFDKSDGLVWKFLGQPAKPFVGRSDSGYFARRDFRNKAIPMGGDFIHFLNSGSTGFVNVQPRYSISLETLPLDVNDEASVEPYAGILTVNCADAPQVLKNYNYPSRAQITWSPETCGDVLLEITLPRLTLKRRYPGKTGFPSFLKDFREGSRTFQAMEFPENQQDLEHLGIQWIKVSYKIDGADSVLRLLDRLPAAAPASIVSCWSRKEK
jgi:type VI secretion system protein ImpL